MHIQTLYLKNFRNIADATIPIGDAALFFGRNGQGKSTVMDALCLLLLNQCQHTDGRGSGSGDLIRHTAKTAEISADLDIHGRTYTATCTLKGTSKTFEVIDRETGEMPDDMQDRAGLWRAAGIDMARAAVAMMPHAMVLSKDLSSALASYVSSEITMDRLSSACGPQYPNLVAFAKETGLPMATAADLDHIGSTAYAKRTETNRIVKEAEQEVGILECAQPKSKDGTPLEPAALPKYEAAIQKKDAERDELIARRAVIAAQPSAEEHAAAVAAAQAALDVARAADTEAVAALVSARDAIEAAQDAVSALQMRHNATASKTATLGSQIAAMHEGIAGLATDETCKTCGQKISAAARKAITGPAEKALAEAEANHATAKAEGDALLVELQPAHDAVKAAREAFDGAQATATRTARAVATAEAAIPAPRQTGETLEEIDGRIAAANASIAAGQEIVKALDAYGKYLGAQARHRTACARVLVLDWLVKAFKDGEVTKGLMGGGLQAFADRVNLDLAPFGFSLTITQAGKALNLFVRTPGAMNAIRADLLSAGERAIVSAAVALAFSDEGAPVLLDDLNHLDYQYMGKMLAALKKKAMGSVIGASALTSKGTDVAKIAAALVPVAVYTVEGGVFTAGVGGGAAGATVEVAA